ERGERSRARASNDDAATQRGGEPDGASRRKSSPGTLVSRQGVGAHGAVFLFSEGSRILLHASETPGARACGAGEGDSQARSGEPADARNVGARGGLQPILLEPNFLARSRSHKPAIPAKCSHGTGGRVVAHRPL